MGFKRLCRTARKFLRGLLPRRQAKVAPMQEEFILPSASVTILDTAEEQTSKEPPHMPSRASPSLEVKRIKQAGEQAGEEEDPILPSTSSLQKKDSIIVHCKHLKKSSRHNEVPSTSSGLQQMEPKEKKEDDEDVDGFLEKMWINYQNEKMMPFLTRIVRSRPTSPCGQDEAPSTSSGLQRVEPSEKKEEDDEDIDGFLEKMWINYQNEKTMPFLTRIVRSRPTSPCGQDEVPSTSSGLQREEPSEKKEEDDEDIDGFLEKMWIDYQNEDPVPFLTRIVRSRPTSQCGQGDADSPAPSFDSDDNDDDVDYYNLPWDISSLLGER